MVFHSTIYKPPVHLIALGQAGVLLLLTAVLVFIDPISARSVAAGALIQIGPGWWFAIQAYRYTGARQTSNLVRAMYVGESGKILLSAALFAMAFVFLQPLVISSLFTGYLLMLLLQIVATVCLLRRQHQKK